MKVQTKTVVTLSKEEIGEMVRAKFPGKDVTVSFNMDIKTEHSNWPHDGPDVSKPYFQSVTVEFEGTLDEQTKKCWRPRKCNDR